MTSTTIRIPEDSSSERITYKNFWDGFSAKPDINTMMLNTKAFELEVHDRHDILNSLPDFSGKDVADIGAGIGRFTGSFAEKARHVIASDFIESFIKENQHRNSHFNNITYKVGDTASLNFMPGSLDLVFTNWMLMYMSDSDVVKFLLEAIKWMRDGGFLHIRESCSEPSTGRAKSVSMHTNNENPTHYRFSSVYIELLRSVRFIDTSNKEWRFRVLWAHSVPTYIERQSNWRQVHLLVEKTMVTNALALELNKHITSTNVETMNTNVNVQNNAILEKLLMKISVEWPFEQALWDNKLNEERFNWSDEIFKMALNATVLPKSAYILCFNSRRMGFYNYVDAHALVENFSCNVWCVETNAPFFRVSLTKANTIKDKRIRYAWHENFYSALNYLPAAFYQGCIGIGLLTELEPCTTKMLTNILANESFFTTLEPIKENEDKSVEEFIEKIKMLKNNLKLKSITEVTEVVEESINNYFKAYMHDHAIKPIGYRWMLVEAKL